MSFWSHPLAPIVVPSCRTCGAEKALLQAGYTDFRSTEVYGKGKRGIMLVTEPPTLQDATFGIPYHESSYILQLEDKLKGIVNLFEDCWFIPAHQCPPARMISNELVISPEKFGKESCCTPAFLKVFNQLKPNVLITIGGSALRMAYVDRWKDKLGVSTFGGAHIPDHLLKTWVCPLFDFSYALEKEGDGGWRSTDNVTNIFLRQFAYACSFAKEPLPPYVDYNKKVKILTEASDVVKNLENILRTEPEWFDFDYEANCIKPHAEGAQLYSASWMVDDDFAYSTPMHKGWKHWSQHQWAVIQDLWKSILANENIKKCAHNMHMENGWSEQFFGKVSNWKADTMVAQHLINTTPGTAGLKFQTFVRFGFGPYNSDVEPYLITSKNETLNRIAEAPKLQVLHYGGLDSVFQRMLRQCQEKELAGHHGHPSPIKQCYEDIYQPAAVTMSRMSINGLRIDTEYYNTKEAELVAEQAKLVSEIHADPLGVQFQQKYGTPLRPSANDDIAKLVYTIIGIHPWKFTDGGSPSADVEVLDQLNYPIITAISKWKKLDKIVGTYLAQYKRENYQGFMHPNFLLHVARTGRSSSSAPNFHNVPKHDAFSKNILRGGILPHKGYHLGEFDFASQEIRIFTCLSKDPVLVDYLTHGGDMHIDTAVFLYEVPSSKYISKSVRNDMKMGWNFALLYGSYWKACANKIWEDAISKGKMLIDPVTGDQTISLQEHMDNKGVRNLEDFQQWCKDKEQVFWDKYVASRDYQKRAVALYKKRGYVETLFGFQRAGILSDNEAINTPTQGSGAQMMLWSCSHIGQEIEKRKMRSMLNGQVHDSIVPNIHPDELQDFCDMSEHVMTTQFMEEHPQIIVPLEVEFEIAAVDQPWNKLQDYVRKDGLWVPKAS